MFGLAAFFVSQFCFAAWAGTISSTLWALPPGEGKVRWLEIHNLKTASVDGLFHVQVLERKRTDPVWDSRSVADHMALTEAALRASIVAPLKAGSVYPERFEGGFAKWQTAQAAGHASVCNSTVLSCLADTSN
jgi:hypothetical protein